MSPRPTRRYPWPRPVLRSADPSAGRASFAWLALGLLIVLGSALRVWRIGAQGLWLDEAFSVWLARQPLDAMLSWIIRIDQHPPLYFVLLHFWIKLAGDTPGAIRLLSALFSTATIPVFFLLGRRLLGNTVGLLAALILAVSPFHIRYAQEARMYALLAFNAACALLALAYLLTGARSRKVWAGYVIFTVATMLSHNAALLFPVAVNLGVLGFFLVEKGAVARGQEAGGSGQRSGHAFLDASHPPYAIRHTPFVPWLLAQLAVLLLWLPWLGGFVRQAAGVYRSFWLTQPNLGFLIAALKTYLGALFLEEIRWPDLLWGGYGLLILLGIVRLRRRPAGLALLVSLFVTPIAGEFLVSLWRPVFDDRTLIWITFPLYLLLAAGLSQLCGRPAQPGVALDAVDTGDRRPATTVSHEAPGAWPRALFATAPPLLALALIIAVSGVSLRYYYTIYEKEGWDRAAAYVAKAAGADDVILFNAAWAQIPFDYYFRDRGRPVAEHGLPVDLFDRGVLEPKMTVGDLPRLRELVAGRKGVWLVYSHAWHTDPDGLIPAALDRELKLRDRQEFVGIEVRRYE